MQAPTSKTQLWIVVVWAALIGIGMGEMAIYENTPGAAEQTPARWPSEAAIPLSSRGFTAVMFVHPRCSCTLATLEELNRLMVREQQLLQVTVLVAAPAKLAAEWMQSRLVREASAIPGVTVREDVGGTEARRFGAITSGSTVVYDRTGRLRFSGGITGARGEAGDNIGLNAIEALVEQKSLDRDRTVVFGCGLHDPATGLATP